MIGTALDVWEVIDALRDFGTPERLLEECELTAQQLRVALAYYEEFPAEIDIALAENRRPLADLRREHPAIAVLGKS